MKTIEASVRLDLKRLKGLVDSAVDNFIDFESTTCEVSDDALDLFISDYISTLVLCNPDILKVEIIE